MIIREIKAEDAEMFAELTREVEDGSAFMMMEPGERTLKGGQMEQRIKGMKQEGISTILIAIENHKLVGYLVAIGENIRRKRHSAYLVIGISKDYRGRGIGTALLWEAEKWAVERKLHRLELTVAVPNQAAVVLYQKAGFSIEGTKQDSLLINDQYVDEYYMAKLLS